MSDANGQDPRQSSVPMNAVRKAWLRELGIERVWAAGSAPALPVAEASSPASVAANPAMPGRLPQPPNAVAAAADPIAPTAPQALSEIAKNDEDAKPATQGDALIRQEGRELNAEAAGAVAVLAPQAELVARHTADLPGVAQEVIRVVPALAPNTGMSPKEAWLLLQQEVRGCVACGLCKTRTQTVFGGGVRRARWMVIGEAPGEQEDKQGKPFVGKSGQLLDSMLASVSHARDRDVFIANVIKCRPPGDRDPLPQEVATCSPYLMRQIASVQPELILVLGRFAAQTLLGSTAAISTLRGRAHEIDVGGKAVPVVVSYHPAYLLRSPQEKRRAWQDLRLAASLEQTPA
ncbi:uracil-DNA glycosylase [Pigmentiphaga litoralis]|uniref:uracil-DNA glycosylase n=1 Tax=Pigmentiphaga litoralis TaxID=516702 RepID=UPI003B42A065